MAHQPDDLAAGSEELGQPSDPCPCRASGGRARLGNLAVDDHELEPRVAGVRDLAARRRPHDEVRTSPSARRSTSASGTVATQRALAPAPSAAALTSTAPCPYASALTTAQSCAPSSAASSVRVFRRIAPRSTVTSQRATARCYGLRRYWIWVSQVAWNVSVPGPPMQTSVPPSPRSVSLPPPPTMQSLPFCPRSG